MEQMIYTAIPAIMADITCIGKNSKNQQQGFSFRGIDDAQNTMKPILAKHQVFTVPEVIAKEYEVITNDRGKAINYCRLDLKVTYYAADGSSVSTITSGEAMDFGDKATGKAMSYAYKYSLFELFCIPTADQADPDRESFGDEKSSAWAGKTATQIAEEKVATLQAQRARKADPEAVRFIRDWQMKSGISDTEMATLRKTAIEAGLAEAPAGAMTKDDAVALVAAMEAVRAS